MRRTVAAAGGTAVLVMGAFLGGCAAGPTGSPSASTAPSSFLIDQDFPDPDILETDGSYLAFATNSPASNIQLAASDDLVHWEVSPNDPLPDLPAWASEGRTWAPDVSALPGGGFVMYFVAAHTASDKQCIGVATSDKARGPYVAVEGDPIVCTLDDGGAIDPATFTDDDGARYLIWKNDGNCCGLDTWIQIAPLSEDGTALTAPATKLFKQTESWEGNLVEAPVLVKHGGTYHVFYSANDYSSDAYAIGVASATDLLGPYTKRPEPLLSSEGSDFRFHGPGGQDVVSTADGDVLFFHGWDELFIYRGMLSAPLQWDGDVPSVELTEGASR